MDGIDAADNQRWYLEWDEVICMNGWDCDSPWCPDHTPINVWNPEEWPLLLSQSEEARSADVGMAEQFYSPEFNS